jgi:hypothetical protein
MNFPKLFLAIDGVIDGGVAAFDSAKPLLDGCLECSPLE